MNSSLCHVRLHCLVSTPFEPSGVSLQRSDGILYSASDYTNSIQGKLDIHIISGLDEWH